MEIIRLKPRKAPNKGFLIIDNIKSNNSIDELIAKIDQLVYQLYDLTEEEIAIVENSTKA